MTSSNAISYGWPCKSYKSSDLARYNGRGYLLYWNEGDRVDLGEALWHPLIRFIPDSVIPNHITYGGLFLNTIMLLISFFIPVYYYSNNIICCVLCLVLSVLNIIVSALDNMDGMHARRTHQCSDLGALLDHYFDSSSVVMNSVVMVLLFNGNKTQSIIAVFSGSWIFNFQNILNYYLNKDPRIMGPEAQFFCAFVEFIMCIIFYFETYWIIPYLGYFGTGASACVLGKYIIQFIPDFGKNTEIWRQIIVFWISYILMSVVYVTGYLSTFEFSIFGIIISWDLNGRIVTHLVLKEKLSGFLPYYPIIVAIIYLENIYGFFIPYTQNNLHFTTILSWAIIIPKNIYHFRFMTNKLLNKSNKSNKSHSH